MGTPDFRGFVVLFAGVPVFLLWLAAFLFSISKIYNKKDKEKVFDFFGTGKIKARNIAAYWAFGFLAANLVSIFIIGKLSDLFLIQLLFLDLLIFAFLIPSATVLFLLYFAFLYRPSAQEAEKRKSWWFEIPRDSLVLIIALCLIAIATDFSSWLCSPFAFFLAVMISAFKFALGGRAGRKAKKTRRKED
ncbi:MAG: hypothetical protein WCT52_00875 [Candidatus Micrarchaeia archaeon]